jgi:hypothetical protein
MALVVADRVKETTTTTGTGAITLAGAEVNFVSFSSVLSDGDTTYYAIVDDSNQDFEVGLGTYATSGNTLTRTTVLASSNGGSAVNLSAGSKEVFITYPAGKSVNRDASGNVSIPAQGDLRLEDASGGEYVGLQAPSTVASSFTLTLPSADGSANQLIKTDGSGNLSFTTVEAAPSLTATASGAIADGDPVIMNSDGTVSKPTGQNFAVSSTAVFTPGTDRATNCSVIFDPNANKSLIIYTATDSSSYLYGVVATVASDGAVTYGTPVPIDETGSVYPAGGVFDPDTNQIVIHWNRLSGTTGSYAAVCSISGTTFTFGTAVQYASTNYDTTGANKKGICYDTTNNKVVIAFRAGTTAGRGIVGTVSGTSISFGATTDFASGAILYITASYDTANGKVLIFFEDTDSDTRAIVGTVSGTSISFGTSVELAAGNAQYQTAVYDPDSGKFLCAWHDPDQDSGLFMVGTVSGTDISFTDPGGYEFDDALSTVNAGGAIYNRMVYDTNINKAVIFYYSRWDEPNNKADRYHNAYAKTVTIDSGTGVPTFGKAQLISEAPLWGTVNANYNLTLPGYEDWDVDFDSNVNKFIVATQEYVANGATIRGIGYSVTIGNSTLTAENFVGIANGAYADTATATIQLTGAVDDAQSGLTAGTGYYVGLDGSLIADSTQIPSVFAGVATSATNLLIKG